MAPVQVVPTEQRCSFSRLQDERVASRCIKPNVVLAKSVHVMEREALGARDHHGEMNSTTGDSSSQRVKASGRSHSCTYEVLIVAV